MRGIGLGHVLLVVFGLVQLRLADGRHLQFARGVPTGRVEAEHGVGTGGDAPALLVERAATPAARARGT